MNVLRFFVAAGLAAALVSTPAPGFAQAVAQPPPAAPAPQPAPAPAAPPGSGPDSLTLSESLMRIGPSHYIRQGKVEIHDPKNKTDIYADMIEFFEDEDRAVAVGNVVLSQGTNRIAAERAEFNTSTGLGTFYNASGIATATPPRQQRPTGIAPPPVGGDTLVYFFGESVEKVGPKKYVITKGGFSTCVQPTPRWEMSASTLTLNLDHYTLLKNAVMNVKGVPMLYLPVMYYPTRRDDRATGLLIPTYGASSLRGQSLHNAFFWAIDRSQDATIMYDWFSKAGQGVGSEYRYNYGGGTDGNFRAYLLDQKEVQYVLSDGTLGDPIPPSRSYEIRGGANQRLPAHMLARVSVDYFSSLATSQTFNTNIYDLSRNSRRYGGNVVGAWGTYSLNATMQHDEYFYNADESILTGTWPRVALSRNERPIPGTPMYFSLSSEFAAQLRDTNGLDASGEKVTQSQSLSRIDVNPQIRLPFKKWQWLTANSTINWRDTYYTKSYQPTGDLLIRPSVVSDQPLNRPVLAFQSQIVGPLFNRIWDTPGNGYAEKYKHSVEPFLTVSKTANVENFDRVIVFDGIDSYVGGTTYQYGLANRLYAKKKAAPGQLAQAREIAAIEISQSYYTNQNQAIYDRQYQSTTLGGTKPSHFSPVQLSARAMPSNGINATLRAEFDSTSKQLMTISAQGTFNLGSELQAQAGWSKRAFIETLPGFNDKSNLDHFVNGGATMRTRDNKYGTTYSFNYDVLRATLLQQRITGFYNAQCCGLAMEYQTVNYGSYSNIPPDHRFFLSFTLAGLGNFSPFNGAMSGVPR